MYVYGVLCIHFHLFYYHNIISLFFNFRKEILGLFIYSKAMLKLPTYNDAEHLSNIF